MRILGVGDTATMVQTDQNITTPQKTKQLSHIPWPKRAVPGQKPRRALGAGGRAAVAGDAAGSHGPMEKRVLRGDFRRHQFEGVCGQFLKVQYELMIMILCLN